MAEYKEITELPASAQAEDTALTYMRTSLGVDSQVTFAAVREPTLLKANKLSELSPFAQEVRSNLGITNSASTPIGNAAGNLVALGPDGKIPLELLPPAAIGGDGPGEIPNARFLIDQNNLSDVLDKAQARANLGLTETANTPIGENPGDLVQIGIDGKLPPLDLSNGINVPIPDDVMRKDQNLEGLTDLGIARQNLGLGNAAQQDETFFVKNSEVGVNANQIVRLNADAKIPPELYDAGSGSGGTGDDPTALKIDNNLSDLSNITQARSNLGLDTAATRSANDFVQSVLYTTGGSKGTILVGSGIADTIYSRPVGTDGQVLTSDSTAIDGLAWKDPTSGGGSGSVDLTAIAGEALNHFNNKLNVQRDEVTIERDGVSNQLRVKALGISADHLADNAVTGSKIAAGSISADKLADGAVSAGKIAEGSITEDKIAAGSVSEDKLANGSVSADKIAPGAITVDKLDPNALSDASLADDSVKARHLNADVITTNGGLTQTANGSLKVDVDGTTVVLNGTGKLSLAPASPFKIVNDIQPQLGGDLDLQSFSIISKTNQNINFVPNGTGRVNIPNATLTGYVENHISKGTAGGAQTLDISQANSFSIQLSSSTTFTFSVPANTAGKAVCFTLFLKNPSGFAITWSSNVKWMNGSSPAVGSADIGEHILSFVTYNNGTDWHGMLASQSSR